jgi:dUTP pyrophosphatase
MKVKIKKLHKDAIIPKYAKPGDAGMDLTAISYNVVDEVEFGYIEYQTGLSIEVPEGYVALAFPRSSVSNTGLLLANSVGVIDSGYRGELKFRFKAIPDCKYYEVGERIAQLVILPYPQIEFEEATELTETERGEGGYGSTNKIEEL